MRKFRKTLLLVITMVLLLGFTGQAYAAETNRLSGLDRYETAVSISSYGWNSSESVVLSTGEGNDKYADALAGTILAYNLDAPMLLTRTNSIPNVVLNEIKRLKAKNVYIIGGTGVVSANIENQLKNQGYKVVRLSGLDRYETAVDIAEEVANNSSVKKIYLTTGLKFQYAMAASSYVGKEKAITLFTDGTALKPVTKNMIEKLKDKGIPVTILGGSQIVSPSVENELKSMGVSVIRIDGNSPQEFNKNVLKTLGGESEGIAVASDSVFADSLSGSVIAAKNNLAIALVGNSFNYNIDKNNVDKILIYGGTSAVSDSVEETLKNLYGKIAVPPVIPPEKGNYPVVAKDSDPLPVVDPAFKAYLENTYGGTIETVADAKTVEVLWLEDVSDLNGVQYFSNIESLTLNHSDVKDLKFLSEFTNLKHLEISFADNLHSLDGIENLTSLKTLAVSFSKNLTDISAVQNLKNLEHLNFGMNGNGRVFDISYFGKLTNLKSLSLNGTLVKNESALGNLTQLEILHMNKSDIHNASFVSNLRNLKELSLEGNNNLLNVGNLQNATGLMFFHIGMTPITDLSMIKNNYNLKLMTITQNAYNLNKQFVEELKARGVEVHY